MTSRAEVLRDQTIGGREPLRVPWRLEPLHAPFSLARRLAGVLGAIVHIAMLPMLRTGQHLALGGAVAFQPVGDKHPWDAPAAFEQRVEELFGRGFIPARLDKHIQAIAILIHASPQVAVLALDDPKDLIEMPLIARLRSTAPQLIGVLLAKFPTPLADGLIRHDDAMYKEQLFDVFDS